MNHFSKIMVSASMIAAAGFAQAEGDVRDSFRALTAVSVAETPLSLALKPLEVADEAAASKDVFNAGDRISFEISGVEGSTVFILNMDSAGDIQMLYPNKFQTAQTPEVSDSFTLPAEDAKYVFEVTGAPGIEIVKVIAVDGDAPVFQSLINTLFDRDMDFPRALAPAEETSSDLAEFMASDEGKSVRETSFEYVIAK